MANPGSFLESSPDAPRLVKSQPLQAGALSHLIGRSMSTPYPDEWLAQLAQSRTAIVSALARLCVEQRQQLRKLENELEQLRAGRSDAAARRVVGSPDGR